jgi:hypothetical protein
MGKEMQTNSETSNDASKKSTEVVGGRLGHQTNDSLLATMFGDKNAELLMNQYDSIIFLQSKHLNFMLLSYYTVQLWPWLLVMTVIVP